MTLTELIQELLDRKTSSSKYILYEVGTDFDNGEREILKEELATREAFAAHGIHLEPSPTALAIVARIAEAEDDQED
jgi:hypothetical protein